MGIGVQPHQLPLTAAASVASSGTNDLKARARATAIDFESVFLSNMFNQMFTGIEGTGPLGGGVWRSFLTEEYAKSFAKSGGIGIADQVYAALLAQQQINTR